MGTNLSDRYTRLFVHSLFLLIFLALVTLHRSSSGDPRTLLSLLLLAEVVLWGTVTYVHFHNVNNQTVARVHFYRWMVCTGRMTVGKIHELRRNSYDKRPVWQILYSNWVTGDPEYYVLFIQEGSCIPANQLVGYECL